MAIERVLRQKGNNDAVMGIGRTFSTENDQQYETIGAFRDEPAAKY